MTARLRPMLRTDLDRVVALERATFPSPWSRGMFVDELTQPGRHWIVADSPWGVVG